MNWYETWVAVRSVLVDDGPLSAVTNGRVVLKGTKNLILPCITALLISNREEEIDAPAEWQLDLYSERLDDVVAMEKAVMRLLHREGSTDIGGVEMFAELIDGRTLNGPDPDRFYRRSLDFRFTPVRSRYYQPVIGES